LVPPRGPATEPSRAARVARADACQAQERQQRGHPRGKIVLKVAA